MSYRADRIVSELESLVEENVQQGISEVETRLDDIEVWDLNDFDDRITALENRWRENSANRGLIENLQQEISDLRALLVSVANTILRFAEPHEEDSGR